MESFSSLKEKSGGKSVKASKKVQDLNYAANTDQAISMDSDMVTHKGDNKPTFVSRQFKNIQGRAVYNTGSTWVDSYMQKKKYKK